MPITTIADALANVGTSVNQTMQQQAERRRQDLQAQQQTNDLTMRQGLLALEVQKAQSTAELGLAKAGADVRQFDVKTDLERARDAETKSYHEADTGIRQQANVITQNRNVDIRENEKRQNFTVQRGQDITAQHYRDVKPYYDSHADLQRKQAKTIDLQNEALQDPVSVRATFNTVVQGIASRYPSEIAQQMTKDGLGMFEAFFGDYHTLPIMKDAQGKDMLDPDGNPIRVLGNARMKSRLGLVEQAMQAKYKGAVTAEDRMKNIQAMTKGMKDEGVGGTSDEHRALAEALHDHHDVFQEGLQILHGNKAAIRAEVVKKWAASKNWNIWPGMPTPDADTMEKVIEPLVTKAYETAKFDLARSLIVNKGNRAALPKSLPDPSKGTPAPTTTPAPGAATGPPPGLIAQAAQGPTETRTSLPGGRTVVTPAPVMVPRSLPGGRTALVQQQSGPPQLIAPGAAAAPAPVAPVLPPAALPVAPTPPIGTPPVARPTPADMPPVVANLWARLQGALAPDVSTGGALAPDVPAASGESLPVSALPPEMQETLVTALSAQQGTPGAPIPDGQHALPMPDGGTLIVYVRQGQIIGVMDTPGQVQAPTGLLRRAVQGAP